MRITKASHKYGRLVALSFGGASTLGLRLVKNLRTKVNGRRTKASILFFIVKRRGLFIDVRFHSNTDPRKFRVRLSIDGIPPKR